MRLIGRHGISALLLLALSACAGLVRCGGPKPLDDAAMAALYASPAPVPEAPLRVFHLGHSLVGRDMPAMLQQLADASPLGPGHQHASQLGWGTSLMEHWEPDRPINGYEVENDHPAYRPAGPALDEGGFDAVVLTEMVEIRDAIRYHNSADYLHRWAARAWAGNPQAQVYLYETWHRLGDPDGWLERIDGDLPAHWDGTLLRGALAHPGMDRPIRLIPAGQVMARLVREVEAQGGLPGLPDRQALFAVLEDGTRDDIHMGDQGAYLVALTHYAVLYGRSPEGLPHRLLRADGTPAEAPSPEVAQLMQQIVWQVVRAQPLTGVAP